MPAEKKMSFGAELIEGHKGVTPVIVPFDPEAVWRKKPVRLDARRDGWLVKVGGDAARGRSFWPRTFAVDVPACPTCQGRMKLVALVKRPASIARYLATVGEATEVPWWSPGPARPVRSCRSDASGQPAADAN